jgi:hyperosmotically inducible protein
MKQWSIRATVLAALLLGTVGGCASIGIGQQRAEAVDDATITAGVKAAIDNDPTLKVSQMHVETSDGVVQLSGFVSSADSVATAASVARTVKGVKSVKNDLRLK